MLQESSHVFRIVSWGRGVPQVPLAWQALSKLSMLWSHVCNSQVARQHRRSCTYFAWSLIQLSWDVAQLAELPLIRTHTEFQGRHSRANLLNTDYRSVCLEHFTNRVSRKDLNMPPSDQSPCTEVNIRNGAAALFRWLVTEQHDAR